MAFRLCVHECGSSYGCFDKYDSDTTDKDTCSFYRSVEDLKGSYESESLNFQDLTEHLSSSEDRGHLE